MTNVLYIHGMGGGGDSRIPSILNDALNDKGIRIVVRTYDFDPESAHEQILSWVDELNPALVIGESLGSVHAIRIDHIYRPREGDRQKLHFTFPVLRKYGAHRKLALENSTRSGSDDFFHAFFGSRDHYRRSGIVSVRTWKKYFGDSFDEYEGTHFTEEEHIHALIVPFIQNMLIDKK